MARTRPVKRAPATRPASRTGKPAASTKATPAKPTAAPRATSPAKPAGTAKVDLKGLLLAKRAQLVAKLREEREGRRDVTHREKIEGTPFGDRPALSPDDEMGFAVADRRAAMLGQIDLALKKMEEGNYGRCEICEQPINVMRLQAHPFAVRCTQCQEAWERDQSRPEPGGARARGAAEDTT